MRELKTVAIIGAGPLGRTLAFLAAGAGFRTVLEDVLPSNLRYARVAAAEKHASSVPAAPGQLAFASCVEDAARDADLILDSVPDELESKLEIFSLLDRMAPPRSIFLTPTRTLSIADLASCTYRPERCVAFEQPMSSGAEELVRGATMRVIHTSHTAPEVLEAVKHFWTALGLAPVLELDPAQAVLEAQR